MARLLFLLTLMTRTLLLFCCLSKDLEKNQMLSLDFIVLSHISFSPVSVCCIILLEPLTITHRVFAPSLLTYSYPNYYCYPYALPFFIAHNIAPLTHKKSPCKEFVFATLSLPCEGLGPPSDIHQDV